MYLPNSNGKPNRKTNEIKGIDRVGDVNSLTIRNTAFYNPVVA